jgi:cell division protein FtsA
MSKLPVVGIDVGTKQIKVIVTEPNDHPFSPKIIASGLAVSRGLRYGYIMNYQDVVQSIHKAIKRSEESSGIKIKKTYLALGGVGLEETVSYGQTVIARADSEITDLDVEKALENAEYNLSDAISLNKKIIHTIPLEYKIDGQLVVGRPQGMKGIKLEVKALFITFLEQHLNDLVQAVEECGVRVIDVVASPIAASLALLSKAQKIAGCVLANIGAETVSIIIYENNVPISVKVFPIGSTDITNDIALGLKISLEEAEEVKVGRRSKSIYPKKKLEEIIVARLTDIFELIENHLAKIGKNGLLPAGVIITGGGSGIATIEDLAKASLKLPSRVGRVNFVNNSKLKNSVWAVSYGLCILGSINDDEEPVGIHLAKRTGSQMFSKIREWFGQFLP